ncbi:hypothetical protein [Nostoc sp.]|uniref:hypothetical protein n=1 Tax=Nostoc sp. TaxID=1180 RepID=UPI002FF4C8A0
MGSLNGHFVGAVVYLTRTLTSVVKQFWILGRTFGALPAQLGFWIDPEIQNPKSKIGTVNKSRFSQRFRYPIKNYGTE